MTNAWATALSQLVRDRSIRLATGLAVAVAIDILDEDHSLGLALTRLVTDAGLREQLLRLLRRGLDAAVERQNPCVAKDGEVLHDVVVHLPEAKVAVAIHEVVKRDAVGTAAARVSSGRAPVQRGAALDVFAVPRLDERVCRLVTPLKPVEAMAGGLPVVASDLPALREIVEPGVTGELIPAGESARLADVLTKLAYSHEKRTSYGRAGQERVGANRTWTQAVYRYNQAYRVLIRKMSGPGQNL